MHSNEDQATKQLEQVLAEVDAINRQKSEAEWQTQRDELLVGITAPTEARDNFKTVCGETSITSKIQVEILQAIIEYQGLKSLLDKNPKIGIRSKYLGKVHRLAAELSELLANPPSDHIPCFNVWPCRVKPEGVSWLKELADDTGLVATWYKSPKGQKGHRRKDEALTFLAMKIHDALLPPNANEPLPKSTIEGKTALFVPVLTAVIWLGGIANTTENKLGTNPAENLAHKLAKECVAARRHKQNS